MNPTAKQAAVRARQAVNGEGKSGGFIEFERALPTLSGGGR